MPVHYPAARRAATSYQLHGRTVAEPYDYLEDPSNPETKAFVQDQMGLFQSYMKSSSAMCDKIYERISAMQNYARTGCVSKHGGQYYYNHNSGLQNQSVLMRVADLQTGSKPEVFLDPNALSADGTTAVKSTGWSQDEKLFAYSLSDKGSDWQHIHVRDAATGKDLPDDLQWAKFTGVSWWRNHGFFYTRYPALGDDVDKGAETDSARDAYICFHQVGKPQAEDTVVLRMPEHPFWGLHASVSDCHTYLLVTFTDGCERETIVWVAPLPADVSDLAKPLDYRKVVPEFVGEYSCLGNDGPVFYFSCTKGAPRKMVVALNVETHEERVVVPEQPSVLSHAALVRDTLLLAYLQDVKDMVYYCTLKDTTMKRLELPIGTITEQFADRHCDHVSFKISSFLLPGRTYVADINDLSGTLRVQTDDTVDGFNADDFVTEQRFYPSDDGTKIPMFIVHKKGEISAQSPVYLHGYGGFDIALMPAFNPAYIMFISSLGGVLAVANIRGGGEYGQAWHDAGRRANKQNCFTDFIAAGKYLHANGIGSPATTAIMGRSNGGMLVAACANQSPETFGCVVCQVGVLDAYKFHKFTIGHAWISDYGDPDKKEDFEVLEKYSPIHNVRAGVKYPAILVVTGDHDDRVVPLHSLKYVATLQHANPEHGGPFLARIESAGGHGQGKPTGMLMREFADMYGFIAKSVGCTWHE